MSEYIVWALFVAVVVFAIGQVNDAFGAYERDQQRRRRAELARIEAEGRPDPFEEADKVASILRGDCVWMPSWEPITGTLRYEYAMSYPAVPERWRKHWDETKDWRCSLPPEIEGLQLSAADIEAKYTQILGGQR